MRKICQIDVEEPLLGRLKPLASVGQSEWVALCSKGVSSGILQWVEPLSRLGQSARVHQSSFCLASGCSCRSPQLHCRRKNLVSSVELEPVHQPLFFFSSVIKLPWRYSGGRKGLRPR